MNRLDTIYQDAVDQEVDRLARLTPCDLMQLKPQTWGVKTELGLIELAYLIVDAGEFRRIAVMASAPVLRGLLKRKFAGAIEVRLRAARLSDSEVGELYD